MVLGVDDQESPHHDVLRDADDLDGLPVVVADLHSALPAIVAGARFAADRAGRPAPRVAYVMTDGGALPAWFSRTVAGLRAAGWIEACVTTGQSFGGDLEAVTVHTGLLAARHVVGADLVVVAQGPGNLGTGHAVGVLRGRGGRGRQRRRGARRAPGRLAAGLRRGRARAAPRRLAPLADGLRPGRARPRRRRRAAARRASSAQRVRDQAAALGRAAPAGRGAGGPDLLAALAGRPCGSPRWVAGSTRTRRRSSPPRSPGVHAADL